MKNIFSTKKTTTTITTPKPTKDNKKNQSVVSSLNPQANYNKIDTERPFQERGTNYAAIPQRKESTPIKNTDSDPWKPGPLQLFQPGGVTSQQTVTNATNADTLDSSNEERLGELFRAAEQQPINSNSNQQNPSTTVYEEIPKQVTSITETTSKQPFKPGVINRERSKSVGVKITNHSDYGELPKFDEQQNQSNTPNLREISKKLGYDEIPTPTKQDDHYGALPELSVEQQVTSGTSGESNPPYNDIPPLTAPLSKQEGAPPQIITPKTSSIPIQNKDFNRKIASGTPKLKPFVPLYDVHATDPLLSSTGMPEKPKDPSGDKQEVFPQIRPRSNTTVSHTTASQTKPYDPYGTPILNSITTNANLNTQVIEDTLPSHLQSFCKLNNGILTVDLKPATNKDQAPQAAKNFNDLLLYIQASKNSKHIRELNLKGSQWLSEVDTPHNKTRLERLCSYLNYNPNINSLNLANSNLAKPGDTFDLKSGKMIFHDPFSNLKNEPLRNMTLKHITNLDISNCNLDEKTRNTLSDLEFSLHNITNLKASGCGLKEIAADRLFTLNLDPQKLETLDISNNGLGAKGIKVLIKQDSKDKVKPYANLTELNLSNTAIGTKETEDIYKAMPNLQKLDIGNNDKIEKTGVTDIYDRLKNLKVIIK